MTIDPVKLKKDLYPIPSYSDLIKRLRNTLSYPFVRVAYPHNMQEAQIYAKRLLGDDPKQRYSSWLINLQKTFNQFGTAGVRDYQDLITRLGSEEELEAFAQKLDIPLGDIIGVLKFLLYWVLPGKTNLNQLIDPQETIKLEYMAILKDQGVRNNLDILEKGGSLAGRKILAAQTGLPLEFLTEMTNRADFTRMPYFHGKTINNFFGAGYSTLELLAKAEPQTLSGDMLSYGRSIGKNLELGMEVDSGRIIARVLPKIVE